jgi:hypothetical protein
VEVLEECVEGFDFALGDPGGGLVEEQHAWSEADDAGEVDDSAGAGRQFAYLFVAVVVEADGGDDLACGMLDGSFVGAQADDGQQESGGRGSLVGGLTTSRTVMVGNRAGSWNDRTRPSSARCSGPRLLMSFPSRRMWPESGRTKPLMISKRVVFPAPLGPMMPRISPGGTPRSTPSTAATAPKRLRTSRASRTGPRRCWSVAGRAVVSGAKPAVGIVIWGGAVNGSTVAVWVVWSWLGPQRESSAARWDAALVARAMVVSVGLETVAVGMTPLPPTYNPSIPHTWQ